MQACDEYLITSPLGEIQSIVMSMYVLFVCLSIRLCPTPGAAFYWTRRNTVDVLTSNWYRHPGTSSKHNVVLDSGLLARGIKTWRHPQNWKYITYRNAVRGGLSHGYSGNWHKELVKFSHTVFELREWTGRQTDKQTYSSHYFTPLPSAKYYERARRWWG